MRIDTSEPSLIRLFEKGQVGMIRTEFMRQFNVIEQLALQKADLEAENERLRKAGDAMADTRNKPITLSEFGHLAMAWNAAKEGGRK